MNDRAMRTERPLRAATPTREVLDSGRRRAGQGGEGRGAALNKGFGPDFSRIPVRAEADEGVVHRDFLDMMPGLEDIIPGGGAPFLGNPTPDLGGLQLPPGLPLIPGLPMLPPPFLGPAPDVLGGLPMPEMPSLPDIDPSQLLM